MSAPPAAPALSGAPATLAWRPLLLAWYARVRRDLPWRRTRDPYAVWISETMLQQTRVDTVVPYFERFLRELPNVASLAEAPEDRVLALWSGLGYYRRARMLHAAARRVAASFGGRIPSEPEDLRALEGVGAYTAGAIASIAFGRRAAVVDGNVARVLARLFAIEDDVKSARGSARLWRLAEGLVPEDGADGDPGDWNQALMELGATVCLPRTPKCGECPLRDHCAARETGAETRLPRVAARRPVPEVQRVAVVLASAEEVVLARRRPDVLFGGLWEPPSAEGGGDAAASGALAKLVESLRVPRSDLKHAGEVTHVLSHRRLQVAVWRGPLGERRRLRYQVPGPEYDAVERVPLRRLADIGRSRLTRRILEVANVALRGLL
jgi:A/G-specific adenine glycosylase